MDYDVIIIGAGLSGLASGIRLAHYGRRVRIFERHVYPGGLNSYYRRNGAWVNVGLHALTNFVSESERSAPLNKALRQLRLRREVFDLCPQGHSLIQFPSATLRLNNVFSAFQAQIAERFPEDAEGFERLCSRVAAVAYGAGEGRGETARNVLAEELTSPLLREMLLCPVMYYGNPQVHDMDFGLFATMFQSVLVEGFARPRHGMKPFLDTLVAKYQAEGGELSLGNGISSVETETGQVTAVVDEQGDRHRASQYLSCAGALETMNLCGAQSAAPPGQIGFTEAIFSLSRRPCEFGMEACVIFRSSQDSFPFRPPLQGTDANSQLLCAPGNYDNCQDAEDALTIRVSALTNPAWWFALPETAYRQAKRDCLARQRGLLEELFPGMSSAIVGEELFTPKTVQRFTGRLNGAIYGSPQKRRNGDTPFRNLRLIGTDQGLLGIVGALVSGVVIGNAVL
ncbi:MAG: NAD(P)/FAD-dependent oxidoreductase [Victivallales bacterium]|nr:NAD(P)/FAD-dependent oxidoreductase [Victivallales bacterium]